MSLKEKVEVCWESQPYLYAGKFSLRINKVADAHLAVERLPQAAPLGREDCARRNLF